MHLPGYGPKTVFSANPVVNPDLPLCRNPRVAFAQALDYRDIGQAGTSGEPVGLGMPSVWRSILVPEQ
ncbi:hypothetical protein TRIP_B40241 [uncultured Desulfatiglans sp.]|nr:hypothetical protein TRIP_B40241 [uncultured Desulfatiglans sp.]